MPVYVLVCLEKCTPYVSKTELLIFSWNSGLVVVVPLYPGFICLQPLFLLSEVRCFTSNKKLCSNIERVDACRDLMQLSDVGK